MRIREEYRSHLLLFAKILNFSDIIAEGMKLKTISLSFYHYGEVEALFSFIIMLNCSTTAVLLS